jgi:toxin secretion/phage lysis holin
MDLNVKFEVLAVIGVVGGFLAKLLGGWDVALSALILFMTIDYLTGFMVAAVFKNSPKSETGASNSHAGFKGLCKKGVVLLIVMIALKLDELAGFDYVRYATIMWFIGNESISIFENVGLMGVDLPPVISKTLDVLVKEERK